VLKGTDDFLVMATSNNSLPRQANKTRETAPAALGANRPSAIWGGKRISSIVKTMRGTKVILPGIINERRRQVQGLTFKQANVSNPI
jgi:hypothetical protein